MRNAKRILRTGLITLLFSALSQHALAALSLQSCRTGYAALREMLLPTKAVEPIGPEELLPPVRRWLTTERTKLLKETTTFSVGDAVAVAGKRTEIVAKLGHGSEGDVYLVQTEEGLRTLKTFFKPEEMEPHLRELKSDFPIPSPEIFARDAKTGRVLMEYVEGASVDHIAGRWEKMGLTVSQRDQILELWRKESQRILDQRKFPPDGYNVIYSFRNRKFYRVDPL